jgi:hypothetical protein
MEGKCYDGIKETGFQDVELYHVFRDLATDGLF